MGEVSKEDADGYINLNVRVSRDDIFDAVSDDDEESDRALKKALLSKKFFSRIAQVMADNEPFSGGDNWSNSCRDAYSEAVEGE